MTVKLEHVYKKYPNSDEFAISDVSLEIKDREIILVSGPPGSGKSTLLRLITGLEYVTEGQIFINDRCVNDIAPKDRDITYSGSSYSFYPKWSVLDNLLFGPRRRAKANNEKITTWLGFPNARGRELIERAYTLATIFGLTDHLKQKPKKLKPSERSRVALGRMLLRESKVLVLDTFLSNLKPELKAETYRLILATHKELNLATTLIFAVNDDEKDELSAVCDTLLELKDGRIMRHRSLR